MIHLSRLFAIACAVFLIFSPGRADQGLTVFAAASLKDALDEAAAAYPGRVTVSYGGSGMLARQVAQGAPADLVFLASSAWMEWLAGAGAVPLRAQQDVLSNRMVLVAPAQRSEALGEVTAAALLRRLDGGRLATGHTRAVPAGIYGRQWLDAAGLWSEVGPRLAETGNVRAALALVARGEAPLGLVYATDARADPTVRIVYEIPPGMHDPIRYPLAVTETRNADEALEFMNFIRSPAALSIFRRHGFLPPGPPA